MIQTRLTRPSNTAAPVVRFDHPANWFVRTLIRGRRDSVIMAEVLALRMLLLESGELVLGRNADLRVFDMENAETSQ